MNAEFQFYNEVGIEFPTPQPAFEEGVLYFGRFRALKARGSGSSVIGVGGTGEIHLVRDELLDVFDPTVEEDRRGRLVALKIPLASIQMDAEARDEVIAETRRAMQLTHPNIVRIHDFHEEGNMWGISMQYVEGGSVDEGRASGGHGSVRKVINPFQLEEIEGWVPQLCEALIYAHEDAHMVHRDIKPKNLMLERRPDGREAKLLVTDFGIARRLERHTMKLSREQTSEGTANPIGSLPYMSPQQLAGEEATPFDDIYAVGATIYDLLTGRPPFVERTADQMKGSIRNKLPERMVERLAKFGLPNERPPEFRDWEEVVAACLAKEPADRPQSMREVARRLGFTEAADAGLTEELNTLRGETVRLRNELSRAQKSAPKTSGDSPPRVQELEGNLAALRQELADAQRKLAETPASPPSDQTGLHQQVESLQAQLAEAKANRGSAAPALQPILLVLLGAILIGSLGGFAARAIFSSGGSKAAVEFAWDQKLELGGSQRVSVPVTYEMLALFAEAKGAELDLLLHDGAGDAASEAPSKLEAAKRVNWYVAAQFADWLTDLAHQEKWDWLGTNEILTLPPSADYTSSGADRISARSDEWCADASRSPSGGWNYYDSESGQIASLPRLAQFDDLVFRLKKVSKPQ